MVNKQINKHKHKKNHDKRVRGGESLATCNLDLKVFIICYVKVKVINNNIGVSCGLSIAVYLYTVLYNKYHSE